MSAYASAMLHFDSHTMQVIMNDGSYVKQEQAYQLRIAPSQRYDVLVTALDRDRRNYPFLIALDINRDFANDPVERTRWANNYTGQLVMNPSDPMTQYSIAKWQPKEEMSFQALDGQAPLGPVTKEIVLDFTFCRDSHDLPRACFNGSPHVPQKVPTLYSAMTTGTNNTNTAVYGQVHPYIAQAGDVVQLVVNNMDGAIHPFHLHGHQFQVLQRPGANAGRWRFVLSRYFFHGNMTDFKLQVVVAHLATFLVLHPVATPSQ